MSKVSRQRKSPVNGHQDTRLRLRETAAMVELQRLQGQQLELQAAVDRLGEFYRRSPLAFVTFDFMARILKMNAAAEGLLQLDSAVIEGVSFTTLVKEKTCDQFLDHLRRCRRSSSASVQSEIEVRAGKEVIPVQMISCRVLVDGKEAYETALIDLSQQKAATEQLRRSWEYAESIVLTIPYPVLALDGGGRIVTANKAFYDVFHTTEEQVRNWTFSQLPDVQWSNPNLEKFLLETVLKKGVNVQETQALAMLRGETPLTVNLNARRLRPGSRMAPMLLVCFEDMTRRRRVEEEREALVVQLEEVRARLEARVEERTLQLADSLKRLRDVSEQLVLAHESEQRRIARELHDQVGQDLTALRIIFNRAGQDESNPARETFLDAEKVTEEAIQSVRTICSTLRPQMLDDLGLIAALTWHFKTFGARFNLKIDFEHNAVDEKRIRPILQSTIFRVIQEALTNVARHAKTDKASVALWMTEQDVILRVRDRGRGFRLSEAQAGHNGLSNIRERVSLVYGQCDIKSSIGRGTIVQVQLPISDQPIPNNSTHQIYGKNHSG